MGRAPGLTPDGKGGPHPALQPPRKPHNFRRNHHQIRAQHHVWLGRRNLLHTYGVNTHHVFLQRRNVGDTLGAHMFSYGPLFASQSGWGSMVLCFWGHYRCFLGDTHKWRERSEIPQQSARGPDGQDIERAEQRGQGTIWTISRGQRGGGPSEREPGSDRAGEILPEESVV